MLGKQKSKQTKYMKKTLLTAVLTCLAATALRADLIYYEPFNYVNGPIIAVGTNADGSTNWFRHSGTANPSDAVLKNHHEEVASSSPGAVPRTDDVNRPFSVTNNSIYTNSQQVVYASFTVNCTNVPPAVGTYFAHFLFNSTNFSGRVFAQAGSLPGTWRVGIAGGAGTVSKILPVDLSANADYQVVVGWDPTTSDAPPLFGFAATVWVNPLSSGDPSVTSIDSVSAPPPSVSFGFRQAGSFGNAFFYITNLAVATTFDEAATNVWNTNAVAPAFLSYPQNSTNFPGQDINLVALANGQGLGNMTYTWLKDGAGIANPNGNSNVFGIVSATVGDSGSYEIVATTPYGLSVTSPPAYLLVTNSPIPPIITSQSKSSTNFFHQTVVLSVSALGPAPLSYQWFYTNAPINNPNVTGDGTDTLTISDIHTNNGTAGIYKCVVTDPYGNTTSAPITVAAIAPPSNSIAFLRTLVDPVNFLATNSTLRWSATGIITSLTNVTSGDTSSYYIQDATRCGINIFTTHGTNIRPKLGDVVSFVGWLSSFNSTLELEGDTNDTTTGFTILSNNIAGLPSAKVIPFSITNSLQFCETNLESSVVMLTNVFFGARAGTTISTSANDPVTIQDGSGETFTLLFSPQDLDTAGQTLPSFAWSVVGLFNQNLGNTATPRNAGYQVLVTRFSDIVTDAPPAVVSSDTHVGTNTTVRWAAVPYQYSYSVLAATNPAGPYSPIAVGLTFTTASGVYTDASASGIQKYYRVVSP